MFWQIGMKELDGAIKGWKNLSFNIRQSGTVCDVVHVHVTYSREHAGDKHVCLKCGDFHDTEDDLEQHMKQHDAESSYK